MNIEIAKIEEVLKRKGYKLLKDELNLIGIRRTVRPNQFDDTLIVLMYEDGKPWKKEFKITTDPGNKSLTTPMNRKGCAILVPGQYINCWALGFHKNTYEALVQVGKVRVYRDNDKDTTLDMTDIEEGLFGINIHRANPKAVSTFVENWSAGCQVFADPIEYQTFLQLCKLHTVKSKKYSYTLLEEKDFI